MQDPTVLTDEGDIFASHDETGMIISYTENCSVKQLSQMLLTARALGLDIREQWWDTEAERHILTFGDVHDGDEPDEA